MLTISSPNTDRLLLTPAELAAVVSPAIAGDSAKLTDLNLRVSALITKACNVVRSGATPPTLRLETVQETIELPKWQNKITLARRPVVTVTSVTENDVTLVEDDDYRLDASSGLLERRSDGFASKWFPCCDIVITYSAGWQTVPYDLRELACKLATMISAETGRDSSIGSESVPGVYEATYRYGRPDDPLVPAEIVEGLERGGYVNHWAL